MPRTCVDQSKDVRLSKTGMGLLLTRVAEGKALSVFNTSCDFPALTFMRMYAFVAMSPSLVRSYESLPKMKALSGFPTSMPMREKEGRVRMMIFAIIFTICVAHASTKIELPSFLFSKGHVPMLAFSIFPSCFETSPGPLLTKEGNSTAGC